MSSSAIVQKLWKYCNVLRDDGMSYGDYPLTRLRAGVERSTKSRTLETDGCEIERDGRFA